MLNKLISILFISLLLCTSALADANYVPELQVKQNGTNQGFAQIVDCTDGVTCTASGGTWTLEASGGSGAGNVGIGTINYMPVYVGISTLGPSNMVHVAGNIGIGSTNPGQKLDIAGSARVSTDYYFRNNGTGTHNINFTALSANNTAGDNLNIAAANGFGSGAGGTTTLLAGDGGQTGNGSALNLKGGSAGNTTGVTTTPFALVSSTAKASTTGNGVTTNAINTTGADLIVLMISYNDTTLTVSDNKSNSWTALTKTCDGGSMCQIVYYTKPSSVGAGHTFTVSAASSFPSMAVAAFSNAAAASPADQENGATTAGTSLATGSVTPSENNELVITGVSLALDNTTTPTINSSFTLLDFADHIGGAAYGVASAYKLQTTAAAVNPTWTLNAAGGATRITTFKNVGLATSGNGGNVVISAGVAATAGTNGNIQMLLGNVGINSTAPGAKLDVTGDIRLSGNVDTALASGQCVQTTTNGVLTTTGSACGAGGSSQWQTQSGIGIGTVNAVGVGTYTWGSKLTVMGNVGIGTNGSSLFVTGAGASSGGVMIEGNVGIGTTFNSTSALTVMKGNVGIGTWKPEGSFVVMGGNIGVGILAPANALDVAGNIASGNIIAADRFRSGTGDLTGPGFAFASSTGTGMWAPAVGAIAFSGAGVERLRIDANGNVGIGTNLQSGGLSVMSGNVGIGTWNPTGALQIIGSGNVGINTTVTPTAPLNVGGNILLDRTTSAIIMKESDGTCGSCVLSSTEVFTCSSIACP